ncbi:UNVERIFIED_CONTAM: UDP-glucose:glycoprotein glucosyltransferase 2 [Gekko kuhli]
MYLSGYGVELAIKSTEYKAVDDSQAKAASNATEEEDNKESDVQGFLFDTLKQNYPDLKDNLTDLRKYLVESADDTEPLKVWELQDISLQAASQILAVPVHNALRVMKDIAQNFPIKASGFFPSTKQLKLDDFFAPVAIQSRFACLKVDPDVFDTGEAAS